MGNVIKYLTKAEQLFLLIAIVFGVCFVKITPPLWGPDETSHFARVYQLTHGNLIPNRTMKNFGGEVPTNYIPLANYVQGDLIDDKGGSILSRKDVDSTIAYKQLTNTQFSKTEHRYIWSAAYSPVAYVGSIVGVFLADLFHSSIGQTIFLARLGSLLLYVGIVWLAIRLLRDLKLKWLFFTAALLPAPLFQASVVTADSMAISLAILFSALLIRLTLSNKHPPSKKLWYALLAVAVLMPLVKPNYLFLSLGVVLVPNKLFHTKKLATIVKACSVFLVAIPGLLWDVVSKAANQPPISQRPDGVKLFPAAQTSLMLHHPLHFLLACFATTVVNIDSHLQSMVSLMGWNWVSIPYVFIFLLCLGIIIAAVYAKDELVPVRKKLLLINMSVLAGIISIFASLYVAFTPTGARLVDGIQGRYFTPFLIPFAMLVAAFAPFEIKIKDKIAPYIFVSISTFGLALSVAYYYFAAYGR
jgi:uncharacterized membrane protein